MDPLTQYILAAALFVLGLAAIGGATFGRKRTRRLLLALAGLVLWAATLVLYSQAASQAMPEAMPAVAATEQAATAVPPAQPATEVPAAVQPPAATDTPPALPPLPGRIAFHSERSGNLEIWVMETNGSNPQQLTDSPERDIDPDWSPDGQTIVFSSGRDDPGNVQLYLMDADGANQRPLMDFMASDLLDPRWSPDGEWIAFYTAKDGWFDVYKVRRDGSDLTNVSNQPGNNFMPDWSPDGSRIVFVSERDGNRQLYIMNADGSNQARLTENTGDDIGPRWSPDGQVIIFESNREGRESIFWLNAPPPDASGPGDEGARLLTFPGFSDVAPAWALDGAKILFSSDRDSGNVPNFEIYLMDADGSNVQRLTYHEGLDRFPVWTP